MKMQCLRLFRSQFLKVNQNYHSIVIVRFAGVPFLSHARTSVNVPPVAVMVELEQLLALRYYFQPDITG
jgi:hypothetical protein